MMWRALGSILLLVTLLIPASAWSQTVTTILGGNLQCDSTIDTCSSFPTSMSFLCDGSGTNLNCPQYFHPDWTQPAGTRFFGITNRTNPPIYLTSTDGITWTATTVQPFTAAVLNAGSSMAVASNGSLLAISGQGANLCLIRRSTDQGASWTTVFTDAALTCSMLGAFPSPPRSYCASAGGYCATLIVSDPSTMRVIFSTDNGASWTIGTAYAHPTADATTWGTVLNSNATIGIITRGINSLLGQPFGTKSGNDFVATPNYVPVPATNRNCRPYIIAGATRALCVPNAGGDPQPHQVVDGTIPAQIGAPFNLTDDFIAGANEPFVVGFRSSFGYILQPSRSVSARLNLYLSTDQFSTGAVLASTATHSTALVANCCKGNILEWGGKIYFTNGATSGNAFFGRIQ